jgi:hypothetical protein
MGEQALWWGGCAWDSFAVPNLVPDEPRVLVATACPGCARPLAWNVSCSGPPEGDSPYARRDPLSASDYFRAAGLHGPFWGLDDGCTPDD